MSSPAVYDTMIFFQWAALPAPRQHRSIQLLYDGSIQLCLSAQAFDEVRDVLNRPELREKTPNLTSQRVQQVLDALLELADWIEDVPRVFTWPEHPDDDHLFNLAIAAKTEYLVTWETRLLEFPTRVTPARERLLGLAPQLRIVTPLQLAKYLSDASG